MLHAVRDGAKVNLRTSHPVQGLERAVQVSRKTGLGYDVYDERGRFVGDSSPNGYKAAPWVQNIIKGGK